MRAFGGSATGTLCERGVRPWRLWSIPTTVPAGPRVRAQRLFRAAAGPRRAPQVPTDGGPARRHVLRPSQDPAAAPAPGTRGHAIADGYLPAYPGTRPEAFASRRATDGGSPLARHPYNPRGGVRRRGYGPWKLHYRTH